MMRQEQAARTLKPGLKEKDDVIFSCTPGRENEFLSFIF